ncbi:hypothetical protein AURDEDRAFT_143051 [Auricularia subglabra TFB-10046 SS5]|nr:hypothetical protein AURDEDRAFT_143051 [Auricularia subglabra TFB-10046 SS5]
MIQEIIEELIRIIRLIPDASFFAVILLHVWIAPFNKVEESFNLHATHDILVYGLAPHRVARYDHRVFPGAVPRSFVGSLALAVAVKPALLFARVLGVIEHKFDIQLVVRGVLGACNAFGLCLVRRAVSRRFGVTASMFFVLLSVTQFHLPFWASRTLPNMLALLPVNLALALLIDRSPSAAVYADRACTALAYLVVSAVVLRAELALLAAPVALQLLIARQVPLSRLLKTGLTTAALSILATLLVDSYFWSSDKPLWPELYSLYFNIYQGKSSDWGVSPMSDYVIKHVPKLLMGSLPLVLVAPIMDKRVRGVYIPVAVFIAALSNVGHKEWRFIVYAVPWLNVGASIAASVLWQENPSAKTADEKPNAKIWDRPRSLLVTLLLRLGLLALLVTNAVLTAGLAHISSINYPGGEAMRALNPRAAPSQPVHVHICNLAAQTGASLFTFEHGAWTYNKTEHLTPRDITDGPFTHAIVEDWSEERYKADRWAVVDEIEGFDGLKWESLHGIPVPQVRQKTQLWILERR